MCGEEITACAELQIRVKPNKNTTTNVCDLCVFVENISTLHTYRIFNFLAGATVAACIRLPVEYFICSLNALTTALSWLKHQLSSPAQSSIHPGSSNYTNLGQSQ